MNKKQQREEAKAKKAADQAAIKAAEDKAREQNTNTTVEPPVEPVKAAKEKKQAKPQTVTLPDGTVKTLVAIPAAKRTRKPKPGKPCECGCGAMTKGGRFLPGHDSRLHSWARAVEAGRVAIKDIPDGERQAVEKHMLVKAGK